jgi:hypothetical protein
MGPLIPIILIVILVVVALVAYAGIGYAYAQGRVNSARDTYNAVITDANKYTDTVNSASTLSAGAFNAASIAEAKAKYADLVKKSQDAQPQIQSDDAKLADADSNLHQNSWLTLAGKSSIDKMSTKIGHLRNALGAAKEISGDYVQLGTFYETLADAIGDLDTFTTKAQASDFTGATGALDKLKTDTAKAITEDKAPGLPPEADTFLKDLQTVANDFSAVINAAVSGDESAYNTAVSKGDADVAKLQADDTNAIDAKTQAFYKPLIDKYNSEIDAANNT